MRFRRADLMAFVALLFAAAALAFATQSGSLLHAQAPTGTAPAASSDSLAAPDGTIVPTFNYQGLLRDPKTGNLINGPHNIVVKLYAAPLGGSPLNGSGAGETFANVPVRDGVFNVVLGSVTPLDISIFTNTPLYVGVAVDTDAEMTPRQRIHPVPWALRATSADTAGSATTSGSAAKADTLKDNATINGLTLNGAFKSQELKLNGVREIQPRVGQLSTDPNYLVNARRWIIETDDQDTNYNTPKLDEDRLAEYCIDEDGCRIWIGMRNWTSDRGQDLLTFAGPYNWSISKTSTQGARGPAVLRVL